MRKIIVLWFAAWFAASFGCAQQTPEAASDMGDAGAREMETSSGGSSGKADGPLLGPHPAGWFPRGGNGTRCNANVDCEDPLVCRPDIRGLSTCQARGRFGWVNVSEGEYAPCGGACDEHADCEQGFYCSDEAECTIHSFGVDHAANCASFADDLRDTCSEVESHIYECENRTRVSFRLSDRCDVGILRYTCERMAELFDENDWD